MLLPPEYDPADTDFFPETTSPCIITPLVLAPFVKRKSIVSSPENAPKVNVTRILLLELDGVIEADNPDIAA